MSFVSNLTVTNSWQQIFSVSSTGYIFLTVTENFIGGRTGSVTLNSYTDELGNPRISMTTCRGFTIFDNDLPANFSLDGTRIYSLRTTSDFLEVQVASGTYNVTFEMFSASQLFNSGPQGAQGSSGPTGVTGAQGPQGVSGPQGTAGVAGTSGVQGVQGSRGAQGAQGTSPAGPQGVQGVQGNQGAQGNQGVAGTAGGTGTGGSVGSTGLDGADGPQGAQGTAGSALTNSCSLSLVSGTLVSTGPFYITQSSFTTDINLAEFILPTVTGGTINGFSASVSAAPNPGTRSFTLYINGTAINVPPAIIALGNFLTSWSGSAPFTSFDRITMLTDTTSTPPDAHIRITLEFTL